MVPKQDSEGLFVLKRRSLLSLRCFWSGKKFSACSRGSLPGGIVQSQRFFQSTKVTSPLCQFKLLYALNVKHTNKPDLK